MGDRQILELFFARSQDALEQVRRRYGSQMDHLAGNLLGNPLDAEECVNDALLAAWNAIPPQQPKPLLPWLYATVRNLALKRVRQKRAEKRGGGEFALAYDELAETLAAREDPQELLGARELGELVDRFLDTLSRQDRVLFLGRYWYGEPYRAMAARLGMTENACAVRVSRTREKLRTYLKKEGVL